MDRKKVLIIGAGSRGDLYAECLQRHSDRVEIVGIAEPREQWRQNFTEKYNLSDNTVFGDWTEPLKHPRAADAVIIATPDYLHTAPAIAYANQGYHILLEKPMAPTAEDCRHVAEAVRQNGVMMAICHVLRYAPYTQQLKALIDSGSIGTPISIQHLEPVGYWHQAHSFVRGNWRNEAESSFMLLAKSCHDLDWMAFIMGSSAKSVSSFGGLAHFKQENAPDGSAERCLECSIEADCPYSAPKIYLGMLRKGQTGWPVDIITADVSEENVTEALRTGPYGRCVYHCDNDVVDHQVVNLEFLNGSTGSFTMTAFTPSDQCRQTTVFGTHGQILCDCKRIEISYFLSDQKTVHPVHPEGSQSGHAGGDSALIDHFVRAICDNDPSCILSGAEESLRTHLSVFAAEQSRRSGQTVTVQHF